MIAGSIFLSKRLLKRKMKIFSISFVSILILAIVIPGYIFTYFLFGLACMDGCYINKYSPKWLFTMNLSEIGSLPVIQPINEVQYYYDTDLGVRWEVKYESKCDLKVIQKEIENYLKDCQVKPNPKISCYNGYWDVNDETVILSYVSKKSCIMIYLDNRESDVLVRALEMK